MDVRQYHRDYVNHIKPGSYIHKLKEKEHIFVRSFKQTAIAFGKHTTFHGFNHMIEDIEKLTGSSIARLMRNWKIVQIVTFKMKIYILIFI